MSITYLVMVLCCSWSVDIRIISFDRVTAVQADLSNILAMARPDLLRMYVNCDMLGLMTALSKNKYIMRLGLLPSCVFGRKRLTEVRCMVL